MIVKRGILICLAVVLTMTILFSCFAGIAEETSELQRYGLGILVRYDKNIILSRYKELDEEHSADDINVYVYASSSDQTSGESIDNQFISDLGVALEKRWFLSNNEPSNLEGEQLINARTKMVDAELSLLEKYAEAEFDDPMLGFLSQVYLLGLKNQRKAITELYGTDPYKQYWTTDGANLRKLCIYLINHFYHVYVPEKYQDTMSDFLISGYLALPSNPIDYLFSVVNKYDQKSKAKETETEEPALKEDPIKIVSCEWKDIDNNYQTIAFTVQNNTNETISYLTLAICLVNSEDAVETEYGSHNERLRSGQKAKVELYLEKARGITSAYVDSGDYKDEKGETQFFYLNETEFYSAESYLQTPEPSPTPIPIHETPAPTAVPVVEETSTPSVNNDVIALDSIVLSNYTRQELLDLRNRINEYLGDENADKKETEPHSSSADEAVDIDAVVEEILSYKNEGTKKAYSLIRKHATQMSEEQLKKCLLSYTKWSSLKPAEEKIKTYLKSPRSYYRYSGNVKDPALQDDGRYKVELTIKFGATNSFGGEVTDTVTVYVFCTIDFDSLEVEFTEATLSPMDAFRYSN